ncbi:BTB/POZ domain-containing protein kctd7-like [Plakobranchus ocellatus]|uniref:BTB/POZ domain-containing protein kctd7-like n=1 Tax=Plakobranchus ocellatus TaxID=259542 RepID=A0AAV4DJE2_9GAST|nr:BTB/POZ domain-containing protein kctd7-like [Plakobranchus ocellatus]
MAARLEEEARLYGNMSAMEYLRSLGLSQFENEIHLDTTAGLAWIIVIPVIYFSCVSVVMALLLLFFRHSETQKIGYAREAEGTDDGMDTALHSDGRVDSQAPQGQGHNIQESCDISTTAKGNTFLRGYVNVAGELQGSSRASGASKGSVRSLGVLTELDAGGICRPYLHNLHPNPPSAPSTLPTRGVAAFNLLTRRRLSKSIDELRDEERVTTLPAEWSALGGRTSLEMNITPSGPQLTLLGSDLALQGAADGPVNKRASSMNSLEDNNISRDSLRASMELHRASVSGLRPDDMYGGSERNRELVPKRNGESSSTSLTSNSQDGSVWRDGARNFTPISSDVENNKACSHTYSDVHTFTKNSTMFNENGEMQQMESRLYENTKPENEDRHKKDGHHEVNVSSIRQKDSNPQRSVPTTKKKGNNTSNVGSNTQTLITPNSDLHRLLERDSNSLFRADQPQRASWSSASETDKSFTCHSSGLRGRPLSLDMLTSWSGAPGEEAEVTMLARRPVPRQLFATTPQMSQKNGSELALFGYTAYQSEPPLQLANPFFSSKSEKSISTEVSSRDSGRRAACLPDYSSSNSYSQESPSFRPKNLRSSAKTRDPVLSHSQDKDSNSSSLHDEPYALNKEVHLSFAQNQTGESVFSKYPKCSISHPSDTHQRGQDLFINSRSNPKYSESHARKPSDVNLSAISELSTAVSAWTSPETSGQQGSELAPDEASLSSTLDSLSSSIAQFHAKRLDDKGLPCARYPLPYSCGALEDSTQDLKALPSTPSDTSKQPDFSLSLDPNPGSCSESFEEPDPGILGHADCPEDRILAPQQHLPSTPVPQPSGLYKEARLPRIQRQKSKSLMEFARDVFSKPPGGPAVSVSPGQGLEMSNVSRESLSDSVLSDRRVTVEQRLSEFGFIKAASGKTKFVVNPSPGKFSGRKGSANPHILRDETGHGSKIFWQEGQGKIKKRSQIPVATKLRNQGQGEIRDKCCVTEIFYDTVPNKQDHNTSDGNNNQRVDWEKKDMFSYINLQELNGIPRANVQAIRDRFQQRDGSL